MEDFDKIMVKNSLWNLPNIEFWYHVFSFSFIILIIICILICVYKVVQSILEFIEKKIYFHRPVLYTLIYRNSLYKKLLIIMYIKKEKLKNIFFEYIKGYLKVIYDDLYVYYTVFVYWVYYLRDIYITSEFGEIHMCYYAYVLRNKINAKRYNASKKENFKHKWILYNYELIYIYSYIFIDLILTFTYRSWYIWFITIKKVIIWSPVFCILRLFHNFNIDYLYFFIIFKIYYYFYEKIYYLLDIFSIWKIYNIFYNKYLSFIFYEIWISDLVKLSYKNILKSNVWFDGKMNDVALELNYNLSSINWFKSISNYDIDWYYIEYNICNIFYIVQKLYIYSFELSLICKKKIEYIMYKGLGNKYFQISENSLKNILKYTKYKYALNKEYILNIYISLSLIIMLTIILLKYNFILFLIILILIIYIIYVIVEKIKKRMSNSFNSLLNYMGEDIIKYMNVNFMLNVYYYALGYLIVTILIKIKKIILKTIKWSLYLFIITIILNNHWIYSGFLTHLCIEFFDLLLHIYNDILYLLNTNIYSLYVIQIGHLILDLKETAFNFLGYYELVVYNGEIWQRNRQCGINWVERSFQIIDHKGILISKLEPYLHIMENTLSLYKTQERLFTVLYIDKLYIELSRMDQTTWSIISDDFIYFGFLKLVSIRNIMLNILTTECNVVAGILLFLSTIVSLIILKIKIKVGLLLFWLLFILNYWLYVLWLLIIWWVDTILYINYYLTIIWFRTYPGLYTDFLLDTFLYFVEWPLYNMWVEYVQNFYAVYLAPIGGEAWQIARYEITRRPKKRSISNFIYFFYYAYGKVWDVYFSLLDDVIIYIIYPILSLNEKIIVNMLGLKVLVLSVELILYDYIMTCIKIYFYVYNSLEIWEGVIYHVFGIELIMPKGFVSPIRVPNEEAIIDIIKKYIYFIINYIYVILGLLIGIIKYMWIFKSDLILNLNIGMYLEHKKDNIFSWLFISRENIDNMLSKNLITFRKKTYSEHTFKVDLDHNFYKNWYKVFFPKLWYRIQDDLLYYYPKHEAEIPPYVDTRIMAILAYNGYPGIHGIFELWLNETYFMGIEDVKNMGDYEYFVWKDLLKIELYNKKRYKLCYTIIVYLVFLLLFVNVYDLTLYKAKSLTLKEKLYNLTKNYNVNYKKTKKTETSLADWLYKKNEKFKYKDNPIYNIEYLWVNFLNKKKKQKKKLQKQLNNYITYNDYYKEYLRMSGESRNQLFINKNIDWFEKCKNLQVWGIIKPKKFDGKITEITDIMGKYDIVDIVRSPLGFLNYYNDLYKVAHRKLTLYRVVYDHHSDEYLHDLKVMNKKIFNLFNLIEKRIKINKNNNILFNRSLDYPIIAYSEDYEMNVMYNTDEDAYYIITFILYPYFIYFFIHIL